MFRAFDLASESWPFARWPRNAGRAIAARMPMIRITTRSSIRVKPRSDSMRSRIFRSIVLTPCFVGTVGDPGRGTAEPGYQVLLVWQPPLDVPPLVLQVRTVVPPLFFVIVKKLPDFDAPTIV